MYDELVKRLRKLSGTDNLSEFDEAADAIESMSEAYDKLSRHMDDLAALMPRWIPVSERLPEARDHVIVYAGFFQPFNEVSYIDAEGKWRFAYDDTEVPIVTHWMPLPEPPKEE
jgi:hypothetical protein